MKNYFFVSIQIYEIYENHKLFVSHSFTKDFILCIGISLTDETTFVDYVLQQKWLNNYN